MATLNMNNGTQLTANFNSYENGVLNLTGGSGFSSLAPPPTGVSVVSDTVVNVAIEYVRKLS